LNFELDFQFYFGLAKKNARNGGQNAGSNDAGSTRRAEQSNSELKWKKKNIKFYFMY